MKWIVITSPDAMPGEAFFIDRLFHEGLDLLHLRKPEADGWMRSNVMPPKATTWLSINPFWAASCSASGVKAASYPCLEMLLKIGLRKR